MFALKRYAAGEESRVEGEVILSAAPAFLGTLVAPRLGKLREKHPGLRIRLVGAKAMASLARQETDIAITFSRPHEQSVVAAMLCAGLALKLGSATCFLAAALLAGAGQGLGQLGGLRLIAEHVAAGRRAEANALFKVGGYVPAGIMPVAAGYRVDACGLQVGVLALACLIAAMAGMALYRMARSRLAIPTVHF